MICWREVHWPRPLNSAAITGFLVRLASDIERGPLIWETRAEAGQIRYLLGGELAVVREFSGLLPQLVPGTVVTELKALRREADRSARVRVRQRSLSLMLAGSDQMLRALLAALASATRPADVLVVQVILGRALAPELTSAAIEDPTVSVWDKILNGTRPASSDMRARLRVKFDQYRFRGAARIGVSATNQVEHRLMAMRVLAALRQLQSSGTRVDLISDRPDAVDTAYVPMRLPLRLTPAEALAFLAWPQGDDDLPGLPGLHPRVVAPPAGYTPPRERAFAFTTTPGVRLPIGISITDACRHTHILGPTGTGKSNLLLHLIKADIEAGRSVVLIDPKRDLAMDALALVPEHRHGDVVVVDPTMKHPVGLNPLRATSERRALAADGLLAIFKGLFPSAFGPRTSDVLHASLLTLMYAPGTTIVQLPALLTDAAFRRSLTARIDDPAGLGSFWAQWEAMSPPQQANAIGPVMSRLRQFLLRPGLRAILDQPEPRFDLADIFTTPKILIVTLNKGLLGAQSASLLGSLIVGQLWQLTLARAALPQRERTPVSLFLDEAQNFLNLDADLGEALEQSRSLKVAWHLAHQFRHQMPADLLASIDANTRNKVAFSLDTADASAMASGSDLAPEDFTKLPQYEIYASLLNEGKQTGWFSGRTLPPPAQVSSPEAIIAESQARYGIEPEPVGTHEADVTCAAAPNIGRGDDEPLGRTRRGSS